MKVKAKGWRREKQSPYRRCWEHRKTGMVVTVMDGRYKEKDSRCILADKDRMFNAHGRTLKEMIADYVTRKLDGKI